MRLFPDIDIRAVKISYRHSRQLSALARTVALLSDPNAREAQGCKPRRPYAETPTHLMTIAFDEDLDDDAKIAPRRMIALIRDRSQLSAENAYTLCSVVADLHVTQLVDVAKGVHVMLPRWALRD
jgi:acetamidase/formamidase